MASDEAQRNFRKLKLDTCGWQVPPKKDEVAATGIAVPASQVLGRTGQRGLNSSTVIPEEPIEETDAQLPSPEHAHGPDVDRSASFMFESQILIEDGQEQVVQPRRSRGHQPRSMMQELAQSQNNASPESFQNGDIDAGQRDEKTINGDRPPGYHKGVPRWPLLQETADALAEEVKPGEDQTQSPLVAPSPSGDGTNSPGYFSMDHSVSPSAASSPVQFPSWNDSGGLSSPRLRRRTTDRPSAIRRESRRSSARSSSARSPASSFLSQFGRGSVSAPDPDEDGQTIGEYGEYVLGRRIGYGGFSVIKEIYSLENQKQVMRAVKIVRKQVSDKNEEDNEKLQNEFSNEVSIWQLLKHEHTLPLVAVFSTSFATFCIMEMSTGGTLFDLVRTSRRSNSATLSPRSLNESDGSAIKQCSSESSGLPVKLVQHYLRQLASALRYLHQDMHIVHRDIKLENCLISTQATDLDDDPSMKLMLCDFGMADFITTDDREEIVFDITYNGQVDQTDENGNPHIIGPSDLSTNVAGSLEYASPEVIRAKEPLYASHTDIWAFGILSHALLTADLPFRHSLQARVQMMILQGTWDQRPLTTACGEDSAATTLIRRCLDTNARKRWAIVDIVGCSFLV